MCIYLSVCLSVCLSIHLSIHPSIHPSIHLYICIYLSIYISIYLSIYQVEEIDERLMLKLSYISSGDCSPIQAVIGSITAQEVMKVCVSIYSLLENDFSPVCLYLSLSLSLSLCLSLSRPVVVNLLLYPNGFILIHWNVFTRMRKYIQTWLLLRGHVMMDKQLFLELISKRNLKAKNTLW